MLTSSFTEVLQGEVAQLQAAHPLLKAVLDRAFTLLMSGDLFPLDDGHTAHVRSQSDPDTSYLVNGTCDCLATQYRKEPCIHRYAFRLYHKAIERLTGDPEEERWAPVETPAPASPAAPAALPEALFSVTLKGTIDGHDALLTARGMTAVEFQANLAAVRGLLDAPASPQDQPQSQGEAPQCKYHGAMKASTKAPGTFFCTKKNFDGSYCRERFPHA